MFFNRLYYQFKPFLPWQLRLAGRRARALALRRRLSGVWPIHPASGTPPAGWAGWPGEKQFALVFTHDVEGILGLEKCQALAEFEMDLGVKSSFNFVPEGEYRVSDELRNFLTGHGFEVGVHDLRHDGKLYWSRAVFRRNAEAINTYLKAWESVGFRSGFMHHNLEWIHDLDVLYDSSTFDTDPFEPQPDGVHTVFPFWVPAPDSQLLGTNCNPETSNSKLETRNSKLASGYIELPYTLAQDFTLFLLLQEKSIDIWKRKLDWVAANGGMVMVDVHPDYVEFGGKSAKAGLSYPVSHYRELIHYVKSRYAGLYWQALPREVAGFARKALCPALQGALT